jgi:murein DD-endopeptidase MepM/ murein hydrolase activator NlpD
VAFGLRQAAGYTLSHAGRQLRIGPIAFWIVVGSLVIMAAWTLTTATYFAFHDDVLTRLIAREAEMQFGYEDRIAELRAQVDRISSRQLLDQERFDRKLEQILRRQTTLESRSSALNALVDPSTTGAIKPPRGAAGTLPRPGSLKPSPINDTATPDALRGRDARLDLHSPGGGVEGMLARVEASLDRVEARQGATLSYAEHGYDTRARRIRGVLAELGLDAGKLAPGGGGGVGGPFVPVRPSDSETFERQLQRINLARVQLDRLNRTLGAVPIRRPLNSEIDLSSMFGVRIDPFTHSPAMHTGLDFRGETGDPVRATANGRVTVAGWSGGYGRMVEVDHGNGLATRYGHLSVIETQVGQMVKTGQVIGRVGSTGRSTGPHLHYETRVGGEAVDPQKFLRAGLKLAEPL